MDIHFWPKNENESHLIILVFFIHLVTSQPESALQCAANTSSSLMPFWQVVLVDWFPLSSYTVHRYLCGIFLNDISTREQFAFLVYCYRVKAIFPQSMHCAVVCVA